MNDVLNDFFDLLVEHNQKYHNFQPKALFNSIKSSFQDHEDMILDFFSYLFTHGIIRIGLDFNSPEMPFMTFTKYGKTLATNESRKIAFFEEFLNIYNST